MIRALCTVGCIVLAWLFARTTSAQSSSAPSPGALNRLQLENLSRDISVRIEAEIKDIVVPFIGPERFYSVVKAELNDEISLLPYDPSTINIAEKINFLYLKSLVKSLAIEIYVSDDIPDKTLENLERFVTFKLNLDKAQGQSFSIKKVSLAVPSKDQPLLDKVKLAQDQIAALELEKSDLERQLIGMQQALNSKNNDEENLKKKIDDLNQKLDEARKQLDDDKRFPEKIKIILSSIMPMLLAFGSGLAVIFFLMAFFPAKIISKGIQGIGAGFGDLASAIKSIGDSLNNLFKKEAPAEGSSAQPAATPGGGPAQDSGGGSNSAYMFDQVLKLYDSVQQKINPETEPQLLKYIHPLLQSQINLAMAAFEMIGSKASNRIFQQLPISSRNLVLGFMGSRGYTQKARIEWLMEAGQALEAKLSMTGWARSTADTRSEIEKDMLNLDENDLQSLIAEVSQEEAARLFHYVDSQKIFPIIKKIQNKEIMGKLSEALTIMPRFASDQSLDDEIMKKVKIYVNKLNEDSYLPYLSFYSSFFENMEDEIIDKLAPILAKSSPALSRYIDRNVVTLNLMKQVSDKNLDAIFEKCKNRTLAIAFTLFDAADVSRFKARLPERRLEMLKEEEDTIADTPPEKLESEQKAQKAQLIELLRSLKIEGLLELQSSGDSASTQTDSGFRSAS